MIGLSAIEGRVLGCLIEKERTVPDQYPMTAHALVAACNQTTSRHPVMELSPDEVDAAVTALKAHGLVRLVHPTHGRGVVRYRQVLGDKLALDPAEIAVVGVLLLRGPQTPAEIRSHGERLHRFDTPDEVVAVLEALRERGEPLVDRLDREPGRKGERWGQLVSVESATVGAVDVVATPGLAQRTADLEARVAELSERLATLEQRLGSLD